MSERAGLRSNMSSALSLRDTYHSTSTQASTFRVAGLLARRSEDVRVWSAASLKGPGPATAIWSFIRNVVRDRKRHKVAFDSRDTVPA